MHTPVPIVGVPPLIFKIVLDYVYGNDAPDSMWRIDDDCGGGDGGGGSSNMTNDEDHCLPWPNRDNTTDNDDDNRQRG